MVEVGKEGSVRGGGVGGAGVRHGVRWRGQEGLSEGVVEINGGSEGKGDVVREVEG